MSDQVKPPEAGSLSRTGRDPDGERHAMANDGVKVEAMGGMICGPGLRRRWSVSLAALLAAVLGVAACGGGSPNSPGVARGPTTTAAGHPAGSSTQAGGLLAYAACMRSHGVPNFPDPTGSGGLSKPAVVSALQAVSNSQGEAAQNACGHLLPAGGSLSGQPTQTITAQQQQDYLNAAACMRSHGVTGFPDPTFSDGHVSLDIPSSIDSHSAQFTRARQTCEKLIPVGLPYSGS